MPIHPFITDYLECARLSARFWESRKKNQSWAYALKTVWSNEVAQEVDTPIIPLPQPPGHTKDRKQFHQLPKDDISGCGDSNGDTEVVVVLVHLVVH